MYQINLWYTSNLYNIICQLYLNKNKADKINFKVKKYYVYTYIFMVKNANILYRLLYNVLFSRTSISESFYMALNIPSQHNF